MDKSNSLKLNGPFPEKLRVKPPLVLLADKAVLYHPGDLVSPQVERTTLRGDDRGLSPHHPQPDPAEVPQVEHVVELGWGGQ